MRNSFVKSLEKHAQKNKNILLLTGDLGFTVFENFMSNFPYQFINMGVAESNMMGAASGLALSGKIPFVYSIAPFVTLRPLEQIRNDVCIHNSNVKIVGVGAGLAYSHAGPTHHINEDIGILRVLPNMEIMSPIDPVEVELAVDYAVKRKGPVYIRLGKRGEQNIHKNKNGINIKNAINLKAGNEILLLTHGSITKNVIETANLLDKYELKVAVTALPTIKPIDLKFIKKAVKEYKYIFTVEEHSIIGGLGSAVSEIIAEYPSKVIFKRFGINDQFCHIIGGHEYMKDQYNLSASKLSNQINKFISSKKSEKA